MQMECSEGIRTLQIRWVGETLDELEIEQKSLLFGRQSLLFLLNLLRQGAHLVFWARVGAAGVQD